MNPSISYLKCDSGVRKKKGGSERMRKRVKGEILPCKTLLSSLVWGSENICSSPGYQRETMHRAGVRAMPFFLLTQMSHVYYKSISTSTSFVHLQTSPLEKIYCQTPGSIFSFTDPWCSAWKEGSTLLQHHAISVQNTSSAERCCPPCCGAGEKVAGCIPGWPQRCIQE